MVRDVAAQSITAMRPIPLSSRPVVQREGFCPVGDKKPDNCSISSASFLNVCKTDTDCPGTKKCCHSGCSKVCASALPVPPHQVVRKNRTPMKFG
ncbi:WAP domain-containing protein [Trichonephila clavipes]|nr:WAP domain-containing protein [Trichonephila clavipes]